MLNNISWASYCYALTLLLFAYYFIILLLYYRSEVLQFVIDKKVSLLSRFQAFGIAGGEERGSQAHTLHENPGSTTLKNKSGDHSAQIVQAALDELQAYITQAAQNDTIKEELLFSLQNIVSKYPMLGNTPLQHTLNNLIAVECKHKCSIHLSAEDVSGLWKG